MSEDDDVWDEYISPVKPITTKNKVPSEKPPIYIDIDKLSGNNVSEQFPQQMFELKAGDSTGSDGKIMDRLRKGKFPIDATLDLHGMTQDQAYKALERFVKRSYTAKDRCVLVITGKGKGAAEGVLRQKLPEWLNLPDIRGYIIAFCQSQIQHGGSGAFYVLIRRKK